MAIMFQTMTPALQQHLADHPILTKAEEGKLADIIHNNRRGKQQAINKLVLHNLKLASKIVNEYYTFQDKEDLFAEAVIALEQAASRFKPGFDAKFSTYASFSIRSRIKRYVGRYSNQVSPSERVANYLGLVNRFVQLFSQEYGKDPTVAEISEILGIDEERVEEMLQHKFSFVSFDFKEESGDEGFRNSLVDTIPDTNAAQTFAGAEQHDDRDILFEGMDALTEREKGIILERFGFNGNGFQTLESIGQKLGVSRERIRQIQDNALRKLRKRLAKLTNGKNLLNYC